MPPWRSSVPSCCSSAECIRSGRMERQPAKITNDRVQPLLCKPDLDGRLAVQSRQRSADNPLQVQEAFQAFARSYRRGEGGKEK